VSRFRISRAARVLGCVCVVVLATAGCSHETYEEKYAADEIDLPDDLYAVSAIGSDHAWAAGYFGAIYHTTDAGKNWRKQNGLTDQSIYDISFADEQNGWAVGRKGFVVHTSNGGDTWELQSIPRKPEQHLFAIKAVSPTTAWAVGDWGGRYYTNDAGKTWQDRSFLLTEDHPSFKYLSDDELEAFERGEKIYDDIFLNDVFFIDEKHGWMAGEYGHTFRTEDGGETWEHGHIAGTVDFEDVIFPPGEKKVPKDKWEQIFAATEILLDKPYLKIELEGLLTPQELKSRGDTFLADERADEIQKFFENEGINQDRIKIRKATPLDQEGVDMQAFAQQKLSPVPALKIEVVETPFLFDVKFKDADNGLITGLGGVLLTTSDGGRTWTYLDSDSKQALFAGAFADSRLIAVGEKGIRRISEDGGKTWLHLGDEDGKGRFPADKHGYFRDVACGTPSVCWMVGSGGNVIRSTDAGENWFELLPKPETIPATGAGE
jgi:photosystem II stability/assembly factor-like uncharacterized protein